MHSNFILLVILTILNDSCISIMYPNITLEKPIVTCEPEEILIQIRTSKSDPSHIYAGDYISDPNCSSRSTSQLTLSLGKCGMTIEQTKDPASTIYRICITVQLHPFFITDSDRSYCIQCVYRNTGIIDDLQQSLSVSNSAPSILEPQFNFVAPRCSYQIRRNSIDGPPIRYALLGETVYHVWKCYGENFQILVQNCYVEDGEGNHILIISNNGCGVDQYILETPVYSLDRKTASQEMHVFKFAGKAISRFKCQIQICSPSNDSCHPYVQCARNKERDMERNKSTGDTERNKSTGDTKKNTSIGGGEFALGSSIAPASQEISTETTTIAITAVTKLPEAEAFFISATDDYGFYLESGNAFPPSIQPPLSRNREEEIQVEPSPYQRRAKRNFFTKRDITLKTSKSNEDHFPSYDVIGVLTVLESPNDVAYFESKYPLVGTRHGIAIRGITIARKRSLMESMLQFVFFALIGIIALSAILITITIPCNTCR
ncbi:unnamed protein product [Cercopithifilaria johnstoni]|uniref:ZP domain-containing protein n=1 Tax=Cercopithifilaria johnstoni TaxID=2874296 RepID=A0A8J2LY03_9BILA|nr:unnamed protein product [Cercopithifilaria johnstoni]